MVNKVWEINQIGNQADENQDKKHTQSPPSSIPVMMVPTPRWPSSEYTSSNFCVGRPNSSIIKCDVADLITLFLTLMGPNEAV